MEFLYFTSRVIVVHTKLQDWYSVPWKAVQHKLAELRQEATDRVSDNPEEEEELARSTLASYPSLPRALRAAYPQFPWQLSRFKRGPRGHLDQLSKQKEKITNIGRALGVKNVSDPLFFLFSSSSSFNNNSFG